MKLQARQFALAALLAGLCVWATPAQAGFISAQDALAQAGTPSAFAALGIPETQPASAQAAPAPQLPFEDEQDGDGRPLVAPNYLRPMDGHQAGMTAPSASSLAGSGGPSTPAILTSAVEPPRPDSASRLPTDMGIHFSPPLPWTPLRPPRCP